ncbi:MAG: NAD(+)/NADH kinase [Firmicutes bacterium]|nr:NAD(+)/NADH kinase [Bacillota bacterium]
MSKEPAIINIFANEDKFSTNTAQLLKRKLEQSGFAVPDTFDPQAELIVCVGGDGSFLKTLQELRFPDIPFVGINTRHLGFFQELQPDKLDEFIFNYKQGKYTVQELKTVGAVVRDKDAVYEYTALNEIMIKGDESRPIHLNLSIGDNFIERFSGDGVLIATPAGSTAYNYSLGGSIVDPRLSLLQVTPIAPMNTTAYRCFTSSIVLPADLSVHVVPEFEIERGVRIVVDGIEHHHGPVQEIAAKISPFIVKLIRFENYDFWTKVKSKFL